VPLKVEPLIASHWATDHSPSAAQNSGIICLHRCVTCRRSQHSDNILKLNCLVVHSRYFCSFLLRLILCLTQLLILFLCLS